MRRFRGKKFLKLLADLALIREDGYLEKRATEPISPPVVSGVMQVVSRSFIIYRIVLAAILGSSIGLVGWLATPAGWVPGLLVFVVVLAISARRPLRRLRAVSRNLSEEALQWVAEHIPFYRTLHASGREQFENDMKLILDEWTFEGVGDVEVTAAMRTGVAAGAALLLHGRPDWELPRNQTILYYPDRFDLDYLLDREAEFDGMAHQQGPIILSSVALEQSWSDPTDGDNVVLHELAHLLDYENEFADGVPSLVDPGSTVAWRDLVRKEMWRIRHRRSMLRGYGATNPAEFFAVAVENFFERPEIMDQRHPELHAALKALFNLDPAPMPDPVSKLDDRTE